MGDEFDTSVDTSSFDDTSSDFSDTSSFDTSTDVGEIMDDSSFEVADTIDESDFSDYDVSGDTSEVDDLMSDTSDEYIETLDTSDLDSDVTENETEDIESLMDDTVTDEFSEVSDTPEETDLGVESDIVDLMDEAALETTDETTDVSGEEVAEADEISELMDEGVGDSIDETVESLEDTDVVEDSSEDTVDDIESLMDDSGEEVADITEETGDTTAEVEEETSDVSDLMDDTDIPTEETTDVADESLEDIVEETDTVEDMAEDAADDIVVDTGDNDVSDVVTENVENDTSDIVSDMPEGDVTDEAIEDVSDSDNSAYNSLSEYYASHNYNQGYFAEYSKDPEWQQLNNAYLVELGRDPIDYSSDNWTDTHLEDMHDQITQLYGIEEGSPEYEAMMQLERDGLQDIEQQTLAESTEDISDIQSSAYDRLSEYYSSHNYGQGDYSEYSKDPEWQALNNEYLQELGQEPIDYSENDWTDTHVEDFRDELVALGIPEDSPELDAIIENEQQGIDEINSNTPIDESGAEDLLDGAEEIIDETPGETSDGVDSLTDIETQETIEDVAETPRIFDDFENSVLEGKPDFYDTGSFYEQGINEFGYQGTCGPTSQANALNKLFDTNEFTENKVLNVAVDNNLCSMDSSPENCGGTTTEQFMELYDKMNEQMDGKIDTQLFEYDNALDVNDVASKLDEGCVLNVAVDANALWDQPRDYVNSMGIPCDDFYSDHWITVTGVQRDELGNVQGFDIIDSGGGVDYVSADKYHEMCFGTDEHRVIDPTAIVVSKKDVSLISEMPVAEDTSSDINDSTSSSSESGWFQRIFGRRNN